MTLQISQSMHQSPIYGQRRRDRIKEDDAPSMADANAIKAKSDVPVAETDRNGDAFDVVLHFAKKLQLSQSAEEFAELHIITDHGAEDGESPIIHLRVHKNVLSHLRAISLSADGARQDGAASTAQPSEFGSLEAFKTVKGPQHQIDHAKENATQVALVANLFGFELTSVTVSEHKRPVAALPKWRLKRVLNYIDANLSQQITLADLASVAGLSRMYFASQFRATIGVRPHDYVLRKRIIRAQQLLAETSESLIDIALGLGFQSQSHFTTSFKKIVGDTPNRWRREQRGLQE